jgi:RND family efflux transporter MFP subunit
VNNTQAGRFGLLGFLLAVFVPIVDAAGVPVQVMPVQAAAQDAVVTALGEVRSNAAATLVAPTSGRVLEALHGDAQVQRGTVIARIQAAGFSARVAAAEAQRSYSEQALRRERHLFADGVIAQAQVDTARLAARQAGDALAALQQEAAALQITAPSSGMLQYLVPNGTQVAAGTAIARLDGRGQPWIQAFLPPPLAQQLAVGDLVGIVHDGQQTSGTIRNVGQSARKSGLVTVLIQLPAKNHLLPGEWVQLRLHPAIAPAQGSVAVPETAIVMRGARSFVWKMEHGRAQQVPVDIIGKRGAAVLVRGALRVGEEVITEGATRLAPGAAVRLAP